MERSPFEDSAPDESPPPPTETKGELVPPPRKPPTAVSAGDAPVPAPRWRQLIESWLDVLDAAGDAIAARLGLR